MNFDVENSRRHLIALRTRFGADTPEPQWLLHGWDINKDAERTFAMRNIRDWEPAPERG